MEPGAPLARALPAPDERGGRMGKGKAGLLPERAGPLDPTARDVPLRVAVTPPAGGDPLPRWP
jgi:hypothetical protein